MHFRARSAVNRKYIADSKARLHVAKRFEIEAKSHASQQAVLAGLALVQSCLFNPTTTENLVARIKNRCLAGSNGALRLVKRNPR